MTCHFTAQSCSYPDVCAEAHCCRRDLFEHRNLAAEGRACETPRGSVCEDEYLRRPTFDEVDCHRNASLSDDLIFCFFSIKGKEKQELLSKNAIPINQFDTNL